MDAPLFRHHLASRDVDWLPPRYAKLRWTLTAIFTLPVLAGVAALAVASRLVFIGLIKYVLAGGTGGVFVGDRAAKALLRARLRKLAHGQVDLRRLSDEADGELVHIVGKVKVGKSLPPLIDDRPGAFRRVRYQLAGHQLVYEAAEDFWLECEGADPILIEVAGARLLVADGARRAYGPSHPVAQFLEELPADEALREKLEDDRAEVFLARREGKVAPVIGACEFVLADGDVVEIVGYKARVVDATIADRLARETPFRTTLRSGAKLPLLIAPARR